MEERGKNFAQPRRKNSSGGCYSDYSCERCGLSTWPTEKGTACKCPPETELNLRLKIDDADAMLKLITDFPYKTANGMVKEEVVLAIKAIAEAIRGDIRS